jgi:predicted nuclease of predicted toxin-antitoxin system
MSSGSPDDAVLDCANSQNAVLMTADKDFGELVFRLHRISSGVILIRLSGLSAASKARTTSDALDSYGVNMQNAFTVISAGSVRIRRRA